METVRIGNLSQDVCRIGLGTWAIGGWMWGGSDEKEAIHAIHKALDLGINLIDTAPVYGFGHSESIVGKAIKSYAGKRDSLVIATKACLNWKDGAVYRDSRKERISEEIEASLKRLGVDCIDLYQVHWPDFETPFEETAEAMLSLHKAGKIRAIGVSNYSASMMETFQKKAPISTLQSPYNIFERMIDKEDLPYCKKKGIVILGYGALCRGLLSGRMSEKTAFEGDDLRQFDPKFKEPSYSGYLAAVAALHDWAQKHHGRSVAELAIRFALDRGIDIPLWGVRRPDQLSLFERIWGWKLSAEDLTQIDQIVSKAVTTPAGLEFMQPKRRGEILQPSRR